jgi:hypothetical protein
MSKEKEISMKKIYQRNGIWRNVISGKYWQRMAKQCRRNGGSKKHRGENKGVMKWRMK